jgi:DNA-directed RNA polymerase specialized sigma24 family protein
MKHTVANTIEEAIGSAVEEARSGLLLTARAKTPCSAEDAKDIVGEAIARTLEDLQAEQPSFEDGIGANVKKRLFRQLYDVIRDVRRRAVMEPANVSIADGPAPEATETVDDWYRRLRPRIDLLSRKYKEVLFLKLDGYDNTDIGLMLRVHRNTIHNRICYIEHQIGARIPGGNSGGLETRLFDLLSRVSVYHAPNGASTWWCSNHPAERRAAVRCQPLNE